MATRSSLRSAPAASNPATPAIDDDAEVVIKALSFVAVYALGSNVGDDDGEGAEPVEADAKVGEKRKDSNKGRKTRSSRKKQRKAKHATTKAPAPVDEEEPKDAGNNEKEVEEFWIAQVMEDVTEGMMCKEGAIVSILWLDKQTSSDGSSRYVYAYEDLLEVQCILCYVLVEEEAGETFAVTSKSKARVRLDRGHSLLTVSDSLLTRVLFFAFFLSRLIDGFVL